jgi:hypothetical protein
VLKLPPTPIVREAWPATSGKFSWTIWKTASRSFHQLSSIRLSEASASAASPALITSSAPMIRARL